MKEKRKYIRVQAPLIITYKISGKTSLTKKTVTKDFSEGGVGFSVYEKIEPGTVLEMSVESPFDTIPIFAVGEVVWIKAQSKKEEREVYDVGIKFTQMKDFDRERMAETAKRFLSMGKQYHAA